MVIRPIINRRGSNRGGARHRNAHQPLPHPIGQARIGSSAWAASRSDMLRPWRRSVAPHGPPRRSAVAIAREAARHQPSHRKGLAAVLHPRRGPIRHGRHLDFSGQCRILERHQFARSAWALHPHETRAVPAWGTVVKGPAGLCTGRDVEMRSRMGEARGDRHLVVDLHRWRLPAAWRSREARPSAAARLWWICPSPPPA